MSKGRIGRVEKAGLLDGAERSARLSDRGELPEWWQELERIDPALSGAGRELQAVAAETRSYALRLGESIAPLSPRLAGRSVQLALRIAREGGREALRAWAGALHLALEEPPLPRDAWEALLEVRPASLRDHAAHLLPVLVRASRGLLARSRRLAAAFVQAVLPQLRRIHGEQIEQAAACAQEVAEGAGAFGEFAALAFIEALRVALPKFEREGLQLWTRTGLCLRKPESIRAWFREVPREFWRLRSAERTLLLRALYSCSATPEWTQQLYCKLPPAVAPLARLERERLLLLCERSLAAAPAAWEGVASAAGALLRSLAPAQRMRALALLERVSCVFPAATPVLLAQLPRLLEEASWQTLESWADYGLQLAAQNHPAALAFFACESRTSVRVLHASSTAVELQDVRGWLLKYLRMLAGRQASVRTTMPPSLRPSFEPEASEGEVELPERIDWFPTYEDNVRVYQWLAVQLAGRWEHGTYGTAGEPAPSWQRALAESPPELNLDEWFSLAETYRVARATERSYAGWAPQQRALAGACVARWREVPGGGAISWFDRVLAWLLSGEEARDVPGIDAETARLLARVLAPLARPEATVETSLAIARALAEEFARSAEEAGEFEGSAETPSYLVVADLLEGDEAPPLPASGESRVDPSRAPAGEEWEAQWTVEDTTPEAGGQALDPEALRALIESGADLHLQQGRGAEVPSLGLYIRDLLEKLPLEQRRELRQLFANDSASAAKRRFLEPRVRGREFFYDEWDYHIQDYRRQWCRLVELPVEGDAGEFFLRTLEEYAALLPQVRREFQKVRCEQYRFVRGLESGEDIDWNAVVDARADLRARRTPSSKLYRSRQREERDVATLFLLDMSASTDEPADQGSLSGRNGRRIIDIAKEALVLMAAALEEIGDAYAIYGFSGHGRQNVEFYLVKSFREGLSSAVRGRFGALEPKRSTRMGAAIRHAVEKMSAVSARSRQLILLSDGFPQDFDYGQDRRSNTYGLRDTTMALRECEAAGIVPFCVTVDRAGHDYLREMCPSSRYLVIDDIAALPRELPKIYQRLVSAAP